MKSAKTNIFALEYIAPRLTVVALLGLTAAMARVAVEIHPLTGLSKSKCIVTDNSTTIATSCRNAHELLSPNLYYDDADQQLPPNCCAKFRGEFPAADDHVSISPISRRANYQEASLVNLSLDLRPVAPPPKIINSPTVPSGYHLTFDDEFQSLSISDHNGVPSKWYTHTVQCCLYDSSHPSTPTYMAGISSPPGQNPYSLVTGGGLDIRLQKTNGAWYSGVIATVDQAGKGFSQKYGYFEMKAKFPSGAGTWPAFWLLNTAARSNGAYAGEIDVVESYMFAPSVINTTLHDYSPPPTTVGYHLSTVADLTRRFHTFGMLWTASNMTFYCDGVAIYQLATPKAMNQAYYPIVDLGLGGGWPTIKVPQQSDLIVQYIRVYSR